MSKRRLSVLTINSFSYLCKVRSSNFRKNLNLIRSCSTAAQSSNLNDCDGYPARSSDASFQNPNGFNSESHIPLGFSENQGGGGLNPNWGFRQNSRNGVGETYSQQIGNFRGVYEQKEGNWWYNGSGGQGGYYQSSDVVSGSNLNGACTGYGSHNVTTMNGGLLYQNHPGVGHYPHNIDAGQYQQNLSSSTSLQNGTETSQAFNQATTEGESVEPCGDGAYKGTIEELDGFCKVGKVKEAVEVLRLLEEKHVPVHLDSVVRLMLACGEAQALEEAKVVHDYVSRLMSPLKVGTCNKILLMYSKCGAMDLAFDVFNKMSVRNLTSWDTMITWLTKNGLGEDAIDLFSEFKVAGLRPDAQMFCGVFSACAAVGDINEGMLHFESMSKDYGIAPSILHYVRIVDMLGGTGHLEEALEFIEKMPIEPSVEIWETLMHLCRVHGHVELGDRCAELVMQLEPTRLNDQSKAGLIPLEPSDLEKEKEKKKLANQNLLEIRSRVHEYRAGDTSHPNNDKLYALLRGLRAQMKEAGYIPETRFVLHDIEQEAKEDALLAHSERLAAAQGLLTTAARSPIRIIKNLRVCGDCHNAFKIISKLVGREIVMRDAKRFHHFKDGVCSCRDYW